jgi:23S rRNA (guanosine2251-2'-O)-methyltransferase
MEKVSRLNPLLEILRSSPRRVNKILIQKEPGPHRIGAIVAEARRNSVPVLFVPKRKLDQMAPHHQGLVAEISAKEFVGLEDILAGAGNPFLVLLDEVEDPQNLGAIIRSAEGAGADGLVLPERRSAGLTETVATVSAGALEHLRVTRIVNLAQTMDRLREHGIWLVGAESSGQGHWFEFDYTLPVAIVLGSEGRGLRPLIRKRCDRVLSIPLSGRVTSLNVAAAGAVFFFEVLRQRKCGEGLKRG